MKFSELWLREWVDPAITTEELVSQLTMAGLEVDSVEPAGEAFTGVVVAQVVAVAPHPDADKLRVCQVDAGDGDTLSVVCGAPNVREKGKYPLARIGAVLPGDFKIKRARLRGVESQGMLCSAAELKLSEQSSGLMELPEDAPVGSDFREWLKLDDVCIDVDLTPNRGDCLGLAGIAREVGVLNRTEVRAPDIVPVAATIEAELPVELEDPEGCPRYLGRIVRGVDPAAETPLWMRERLRRSGIRSLGPLVDVTNYVMLELGQPMHAFDLAQLEGGIRVRRARAGEKLVMLDGSELELDEEVLMIADHVKPVAMAGIMGGEHSGCNDATTSVFLEAAFFAPQVIAGRGRRFGLHTDASHRFERGVDPTLQRDAMERATRLLIDICGGEAGPITEAVSERHLPERGQVRLRRERLRRVLGLELQDTEVEEILARLGLNPRADEAGWTVTAPGYRFDIAIEEDLIEEVGRIHGYEAVPESTPHAALEMRPIPEGRVEIREMKRVLVERGYQEAITYSFVDPELQRLLDPEMEPVALANPISADMAVMRTTLWSGLLQAAVYNQKRQQNRVRLFEAGLLFRREGGDLQQKEALAGVILGNVEPEQWGCSPRESDFYDLKSDVEAVLGLTGPAGGFIFSPTSRHPALHPGQSARIEKNDKTIGWIGALHPAIERRLGLQGRGVVFEIDVASITEGSIPAFRPISRFPAIRRDLAVVVDEAVPAQEINRVITAVAGDLLTNLQLFDVYRGKGVDSGRKSLALGLTLQDQSRTLKDKEVEKVLENVLMALNKEFGATLRD
ncbi:MAG: phenylalanine--tRNA ligase subunit beta [Gammaproteobacteria bacterium]